MFAIFDGLISLIPEKTAIINQITCESWLLDDIPVIHKKKDHHAFMGKVHPSKGAPNFRLESSIKLLMELHVASLPE